MNQIFREFVTLLCDRKYFITKYSIWEVYREAENHGMSTHQKAKRGHMILESRTVRGSATQNHGNEDAGDKRRIDYPLSYWALEIEGTFACALCAFGPFYLLDPSQTHTILGTARVPCARYTLSFGNDRQTLGVPTDEYFTRLVFQVERTLSKVKGTNNRCADSWRH